MRTFLIALLLLPTVAFASGACYSPSDCVGMEHCTSLDDGIVPGRCTTDARIINAKPAKALAPAPKKPASSSAPASSSVVSSPASSIVSSSASSTPTMIDDQQGVLAALYASIMGTMKSLYDSVTSMMSSMLRSMKCIFGCSE